MVFIGLDPGKHGGIAVVNEFGRVLQAVAMPATERDVLDVLMHLSAPVPSRAILERVWSSPQMGVASAFTFGKGYGALRMALTAARIPFDEVTPGKWQAVMGCLSGGEKNVTKGRAQQLFPSLRITHSIADALLLAEFCRRTHGGRGTQAETGRSMVRGPSALSAGSLQGEPGERAGKGSGFSRASAGKRSRVTTAC